MKKKQALNFSRDSLASYLQEAPLVQSIGLDKGDNILFHWANWNRSCEFMRDHIDKDDYQARVSELDEYLDSFKETALWAKRGILCEKISLYDLYVAYLDPRIKLTWNKFQESTLISFDKSSGPYVHLTSMRWFDPKIYAAFLYRKMLNNYVPLRDLRLEVNIPVKCRFQNMDINPSIFRIHQMMKDGLVLEISGTSSVYKFVNGENVQLEFDVSSFGQVSKKQNYDEIMKTFSSIDLSKLKEGSLSRFKVSKRAVNRIAETYEDCTTNGTDYYFFISYDDLKGEGKVSLSKTLSGFVDKVEEGIIENLKHVA